MSNKISRVCGQNIPDTQCGLSHVTSTSDSGAARRHQSFRLRNRDAHRRQPQRVRIESVPISTVYSDEVSSIHPVRDTLRFFKLMQRYRKL